MKKLNSTTFLSILLMLFLSLGIHSNTHAQTLLTQQGDITAGGGYITLLG